MIVLDTSAVLAFLWQEEGSVIVEEKVPEGVISSVNLAELGAKLADRGAAADQIAEIIAALDIDTLPFDHDQGIIAGQLRAKTRQFGLSLGDRACLATAIQQNCAVLTADRTWSKLELDIEIEQIR